MIMEFKMVTIGLYLIGTPLTQFFIVVRDPQKFQMKIYQIYTQEEYLLMRYFLKLI